MSLPYFPMYPCDYEADTSHLTLLEDGAYNRLLRLCWMTSGCSLPDDDAWIMRRMRAHTDDEKQAVLTVLGEFFALLNGRYSNARLTREYDAAKDAYEKRKAAGAKGGKSKALKTKEIGTSNAIQMLKQPEPEPEPDISSSLRSDDGALRRDNPIKPDEVRSHLEAHLTPERAKGVIDHRRAIKKPLTAHAAKLLAAKFAQWHDPNAAADAMIANGWQGFDPSWMERHSNGRGQSPPPKPKTDLEQIMEAARARGYDDGRQPNGTSGPDSRDVPALPGSA